MYAADIHLCAEILTKPKDTKTKQNKRIQKKTTTTTTKQSKAFA